jgi:type II secretory pathway predicted ATPase ExeA
MSNKLLTHFGFTKMPFTKDVRREDIFKSSMIQNVQGMFDLGISTEDMMLVSGEIGCGKSVALRLFLDSLDGNRYYPLYLKSGGMNAAHLYKAILSGLKIDSPFRLHAAKMLYEKAIPEFRKKPIIILDDAQDLGDDALLEIKNLVSFDADSKNRLCVIIAGQSEIAEKLQFALFASVKQRIRLQYQAEGMTLEETCQYVQHHMSICGRQTSLFSEDAKAEIFKRSNGISRLVNKECYIALIAAYTKGRDLVEPSLLPPFNVQK